MADNEGDDPRVPVEPLDPQPPQPPIGNHPLVDADDAAPAGVAPAGVVGGPPLAGVVGGPPLAGVAGGVVVPATAGTPTGVIFVIFIRGFGSAKIPPTSSIVFIKSYWFSQ